MSPPARSLRPSEFRISELRGGADDEQTASLAQSIQACMHGLVSFLLARPGFPWVERDHLVTARVAAVRRMAEASAGA